MVACGTKGVPLLYVICNKGDPNYDFEDWKKLAVNCASLNGKKPVPYRMMRAWYPLVCIVEIGLHDSDTDNAMQLRTSF